MLIIIHNQRIDKKTNDKESKNTCCKRKKMKNHWNFYILNNMSNKQKKIPKSKFSLWFIVFEYVKANHNKQWW